MSSTSTGETHRWITLADVAADVAAMWTTQ
ncbi:hypothetical protein Tco_0661578, partial [Tanacetum coccineum]